MKFFYFLFSLLFLLTSCEKNEKLTENIFQINGFLPDFEKKTVYLIAECDSNVEIIDSTYINNSEFFFSGKVGKYPIYGISVTNVKETLGIFIDADTISIKINSKNIDKSIVEGSKIHDQFEQYTNDVNQITNKIKSLYPLIQKARIENDLEKLKELNNRIKKINNQAVTFSIAYSKANSQSFIAIYSLYNILHINDLPLKDIQEAFNSIDAEFKVCKFAEAIRTYLELP